jgi:hypothetical protein
VIPDYARVAFFNALGEGEYSLSVDEDFLSARYARATDEGSCRGEIECKRQWDEREHPLGYQWVILIDHVERDCDGSWDSNTTTAIMSGGGSMPLGGFVGGYFNMSNEYRTALLTKGIDPWDMDDPMRPVILPD